MKKHPIIMLVLLMFCGLGFSQEQKNEDRAAITLCWVSDLDTSARYMVYFNRYGTADTAWRLIGITKEKELDVAKESFKGNIAFGVRVIYFGDTSAIHKSLDDNACANPESDCDSSCTNGPWYLSWHIHAPKGIQYKKKSGN